MDNETMHSADTEVALAAFKERVKQFIARPNGSNFTDLQGSAFLYQQLKIGRAANMKDAIEKMWAWEATKK